MEESFAHLLDDFVDEAILLIEGVTLALMDLEKAWAKASHDEGAIRRLKSNLHTLKGNAAMMGLVALEAVAHTLEDVCDLLTDDATSAAILREGRDLLEKIVGSAANEPRYSAAAAAFVARGADFLEGSGRAEPPKSAAVPPGPVDSQESRRWLFADTLRIRFSQLDEMLELVGEATLLEGTLAQSSQQLLRVHGNLHEVDRIDQAAATLRKILKQLDEKLMEARLLPFSTHFEKFRRYVNDLARDHGRQIRLVTTGGEITFDKKIIDCLSEPLLHLVRNAVAHGLEPPEIRIAAGKPAEGTILLAARQIGNLLVINVADDGRGLDLKAILARAEAMGQDPTHLTPNDIPRLIFTQGLSTAAEVSVLAGRGVGLDIVATSMRTLGASIDVRSTPGQGTVFDLTLPLTLSMTKGLLVGIDGETFVIPTSYVAEGLRLEDGVLHEVHRLGVLTWRGGLIHVSDGGALLSTPGYAGRARAARRHCVVLSAGTRRRGLLVDTLLGYRVILVKPLDAMLDAPKEVSGATLLDDGSVALILDAVRILEKGITGASPEARPSVEPKRP